MVWDRVLERADWLSSQERELFVAARPLPLLESLEEKRRGKLAAVLCSILYAERASRAQGRRLTAVLEALANQLHLTRWCSETLGPWQLHLCHAPLFGETEERFHHQLLDKKSATRIAIDHVTHHIGLHKEPPIILAEYHHNLMACSVAALQHLLNMRHPQQPLREDGLLGPETREALLVYTTLPLNEARVLSLVEQLSCELQCTIPPFVPQVVIRRDATYCWDLWKRVLTGRGGQLSNLFRNHIDVPGYVAWGMSAYEKLGGC